MSRSREEKDFSKSYTPVHLLHYQINKTNKYTSKNWQCGQKMLTQDYKLPISETVCVLPSFVLGCCWVCFEVRITQQSWAADSKLYFWIFAPENKV